ncbi:hypothetical protein [Vibrio bivalvicida]|uniref:Uncharacterized protein n=1 Tax=Vibrio bivalvicida TaxID=1276888 RepID=A0ABV4MFA1_9VIBR
MRRVDEKGWVTLLVTSVLLISTLVLGLTSYKVLFYQIKRAQNEIKVRQAHWLSEAGIECVYAYIHRNPDKLSALSSASNTLLNDVCKQDLKLESLYIEPLSGDSYVVHANSENYRINRRFHHSEVSGMGTIQSRADLRLIGSIDIAPDAPREVRSDGLYECVAVRYLSKVVFETEGSTGTLSTRSPMRNGPYSGFNGECAPEYKTSLSSNQSTSEHGNLFKNDYQQDSQLSTFNNYFNMEKSAENIALAKLQYQVISLATMTDGHNCADVINTYLTPTANKLWIEGHCVITTLLNVSWPSSLVVENGIFAATGPNVFAGSFYHLVDMSSLDFSELSISEYWNEVSFKNSIETWLGNKTVYFDNGAFHPEGGMHFDAEGGEAVLKGSYDLDYFSSNNPVQGRKVFTWYPGGWYVQ